MKDLPKEFKFRRAARILAFNGYEDTVVFENPGFDNALIGVDYNGKAIYDFNLMIDYLIEVDGMTADEAVEWIDYNTARACEYQQDAPIILYHIEMEEADEDGC